MAFKDTVKEWFKTGLKPTQAQFYSKFDFLRWKDEKIPIADIEEIENILNEKADAEALTNHLGDAAAHTDLFAAKADAQALLNHIQSTFEAIGLEGQNRVYGDENLQFQIDDTNDFVSQARSDIDAINTLLTSNDINLDTVQEIVTAIKNVQTSLSTILVNDLTTGGTTKALTAEMGKTLKGLIDGLTTNKVDKVAGERLINAAEITKLAGLGSIVTTIKPIVSTALATQNVAGFVTYINALTPVLVVGASEIVKYQTTDTGRVFQLNLRGRSFGVGQPAIVAADVLEVTDFLNKDIKLSNYPNTRNDGQLPTNRVLSTDVNGNLKMYTIATAPAPYLEILVPDSTLPSTTTNFVLKGAFFTPAMTVSIVGQTINYITFVSDNLVKVNVTTGAAEGSYAVTLNNGLSVTFPNALLIVLGTVYTPIASDWVNITGTIDTSLGSTIDLGIAKVQGTADWLIPIPANKNFRLRFTAYVSPLNFNPSYNEQKDFISLKRISNNSRAYTLCFSGPKDNPAPITSLNDTIVSWQNNLGFPYNSPPYTDVFEFRRIGNIMVLYKNNGIYVTFENIVQEQMYISVSVKDYAWKDIKYIETA